MSFDPEYENRKDHRKSYYDSRDFDRSCRSNGGCPRCHQNRLYSNNLKAKEADDEIEDYLDNC